MTSQKKDDPSEPTYTLKQVRETMAAVEGWLNHAPNYPDVIHPTELFNDLLAWATRLSNNSQKLPPY